MPTLRFEFIEKFSKFCAFVANEILIKIPVTSLKKENIIVALPSRVLFIGLRCCFNKGDENADETLTSVSTSEDGEHEPLSEEKEILDNLRPVSPKPGHIERVKAPTSPQSRRHEARFLKINVRLITDGQVRWLIDFVLKK